MNAYIPDQSFDWGGLLPNGTMRSTFFSCCFYHLGLASHSRCMLLRL